jgi:hypothetical protein
MATPAEAKIASPVPQKDTEPDLATEIRVFEAQCLKRYTFNNGWDVALTAGGILLGIGVAAAGVFFMSRTSAILGAFVTAVVSAQRAFPFSQRAQFYRSLIGQASNLRTDLAHNLISEAAAATVLKSLRLDFAQQLPRGGSSTTDTTASTNKDQANKDQANKDQANKDQANNNQSSSSDGSITGQPTARKDQPAAPLPPPQDKGTPPIEAEKAQPAEAAKP